MESYQYIQNEKSRLLNVSRSNPDVYDIIDRTIKHIDSPSIVTGAIKDIELKYKSIYLAWELSLFARIACEKYKFDIVYTVQYGILSLKMDNVSEAEKAITEYKIAEHEGRATHNVSRFGKSTSNSRFRMLEASVLKSRQRFDEAIEILETIKDNQFADKLLREVFYLKTGKIDIDNTEKNIDSIEALMHAKECMQNNDPDRAYALLKPFLGLNIKAVDYFVSGIVSHVSSNLLKSNNDKSNIHINISGTVGNLNLGNIIGDITNNLNKLSENKKDSDFKRIINELIEEVTVSDDLRDQDKKEVVENLQFITTEALQPPQKQNISIIKSIIKGVGVTLNTVGSLASIWSIAGPKILSYFGL